LLKKCSPCCILCILSSSWELKFFFSYQRWSYFILCFYLMLVTVWSFVIGMFVLNVMKLTMYLL
jgi:hypothetical protein